MVLVTMKKLFAFIFVLCCFLLAACSQQKVPNISSINRESEDAISETASYLPSPGNASQQADPPTGEQQTSVSQVSFSLHIPTDGAVELSFFRIGGGRPEIVDTTKDTTVITAILQTINNLEFVKSPQSDEAIRMRNGASSSIHIDYRDGSCKIFRNQSGWYQYTDCGEQWLEQTEAFDINQFIADEMNVKLWN